MKNIVAAIDFDEEATDVLEHAAELATALGAEVNVVHIYPPTPDMIHAPYIYPNTMGDESVEEHEESLQAQKQSLREMVGALHKKGIKAAGFMKPADSNYAKAILEFSDERDADLIVMGTHRPGRLERFVIGSIAEEVLHKSTIPMLVIPRPKSQP